MAFGLWLQHMLGLNETKMPASEARHEITAVFAGGLGEPARSLNAMRTILGNAFNIHSTIGATYNLLDVPPFPYEKAKEVGRPLYVKTKRIISRKDKKIILIGHSLGGIFSLYTAHRLIKEGRGDNIHKIFLLGAPLYGIDPRVLLTRYKFARDILSRPLLTRANRELSLLTDTFLADIPLSRIVTIYSESDVLVDRSQATIRGAINEKVDPGHLLMIASFDVAKIIVSHL